MRDIIPALKLHDYLHTIGSPALLPQPFSYMVQFSHSNVSAFLSRTFEEHYSNPGARGLHALYVMSPATLLYSFYYVIQTSCSKTFLLP